MGLRYFRKGIAPQPDPSNSTLVLFSACSSPTPCPIAGSIVEAGYMLKAGLCIVGYAAYLADKRVACMMCMRMVKSPTMGSVHAEGDESTDGHVSNR